MEEELLMTEIGEYCMLLWKISSQKKYSLKISFLEKIPITQ